MIKNLNQLKRALRPGMRLEVIGHCRPGCIGGAILWWGAARTWEFEDGVCKSYTRSEHTAETLIMAFRVLEKEAA